MTFCHFSNLCRKKIPDLTKEISSTYWMNLEVLPHDFCKSNMTQLIVQTVPTKSYRVRSLKNRRSIPMSFKLGLTWKYAHLASFANVKYRIRLAGIVRRFVCTYIRMYVLVCVVEVQQCTEALVLSAPPPPLAGRRRHCRLVHTPGGLALTYWGTPGWTF